MKAIMSGIFAAFSMYSAVPVPSVKWEKATLRWALGFLPFVGVLIGLLEYLWHIFCIRLGVSGMLYAAVSSAIPIAVSGGIHLDGFCDSCDAICSFADKEKRLEIMKDPDIGAFGAIWLMAFLLMETACFFQLYEAPGCICLAFTGFAFSRAFGAGKIVLTKCAKNTGLAKIFSENSDKAAVTAMLAAEAVLLVIFMLGAVYSIPSGIYAVITGTAAVTVWYILHDRMCLKKFGGITGDLAGFFISVAELIMLVIAALGGLTT